MKHSDLQTLLTAVRVREPVLRLVDMSNGEVRLVRANDIDDADPLAGAFREAFRTGRSVVVGGAAGELFIDTYLPPLRLVLLGAVHIAQALIPMAQAAGYAVTVIDPRSAFATPERFPGITLDARWPDAALADLSLDAQTAFCALTHDPKIDEPGLAIALQSDAFYVGALGSRRTHEKRCARLRDLGVPDAAISRIRAPIGLDIGAVGAVEIAISVIAEITAVLRARSAPA